MPDIEVVNPVDVEAELDRLAARYRSAGGAGLQVLNLIGGQAEGLIDRLPKPVRDGLGDATERALRIALQAASASRSQVPDQAPWLNTAVTTAMGAAGGFGGLPTALVELPVTTTVLLRAIQGAALERGFDPAAQNIQFDCLQVFSAAGPLDHDDGADMGFLSLRLSLTGGAMQKVIATVAPRLAGVLGQKLAAQAVPVLGAVAGAATNYAYTSYYQNVAHVHFGLRRLSIDGDISHDALIEELRRRVNNLPAR
ncbi:EcsC family protein [Thalassococcus sp. S3]|uniref:EcsC family protein n=1 Tax=Thalassococcus sp. S3 TaxID=2017482 RepID=UPI001024124B|nr:EcsC family protein [Thalassococcus sp. S3]QBF32924.1 protein EcsC [Thalassococcus sp. S3]